MQLVWLAVTPNLKAVERKEIDIIEDLVAKSFNAVPRTRGPRGSALMSILAS
jgi:hypothetical protein